MNWSHQPTFVHLEAKKSTCGFIFSLCMQTPGPLIKACRALCVSANLCPNLNRSGSECVLQPAQTTACCLVWFWNNPQASMHQNNECWVFFSFLYLTSSGLYRNTSRFTQLLHSLVVQSYLSLRRDGSALLKWVSLERWRTMNTLPVKYILIVQVW